MSKINVWSIDDCYSDSVIDIKITNIYFETYTDETGSLRYELEFIPKIVYYSDNKDGTRTELLLDIPKNLYDIIYEDVHEDVRQHCKKDCNDYILHEQIQRGEQWLN